MAVDRELLKEVTQELWNTVKKLRPEIDRQTRLQLVLKALLTIGDLPDQMQAAMVVGVCAEWIKVMLIMLKLIHKLKIQAELILLQAEK